MEQRLALKRLSESDLTLFEIHFRLTNGTKQKAFNMDRAVFIDLLFPELPARLDVAKDRVPLDLSIYGPGEAGLHNLQRKILKQKKNWRLNGELIYDPPDEEGRYDPLRKGDFAIFDFADGSEPRAARMYLIASALKEDKGLHAALDERYSPALSKHRSMVLIEPAELQEIIDGQSLAEGHPVNDLIDGGFLEDAAQNGAEGIAQLKRRRGSRGVSRSELDRARKSAERIGLLGEEILNEWFDRQTEGGHLEEYQWDAYANALSPFDFTIRPVGGADRSVDAKSTAGPFANRIHISLAELEEMAYGARVYDIYRLYEVAGDRAKLRVSEDMKAFASAVLNGMSSLPEGVRADSVSVDPLALPFGEEQIIDTGSEESEPETPDLFGG